ncbi:MAG: alpha/beta fold hydrolase [Paludibacteraceae bacterium]|nr:alpha/beta fold hydrolase [Paludibacteraceae bacterium]MEE3482922.1 YqiA/YcfP family alpha/beta fold hydrolase [Bacteroidales bacterium]
MKEILFLHGMASSGKSDIVDYLRKYLPDMKVWAPDLSIDPQIAFPQIDSFLKEHSIDLLIGHSLGGFMAQKYRGIPKILLNPSLGMTYMYLFQGDNKYKSVRENGIQIWHVDKRMCQQYKEMERTEFDDLTKEEDELTVGMFGRYDFMTRMSAHWFRQHYTHRHFMPGWHNPPEVAIRDYVVKEVRRLLA